VFVLVRLQKVLKPFGILDAAIWQDPDRLDVSEALDIFSPLLQGHIEDGGGQGVG